MSAKTLFEKVWEQHQVVPESADTPAVLYIDLHLVHEVTSPQAFSVLRAENLKVRRPDRVLATMDHSTPTDPDEVFGRVPIKVESAARQPRSGRDPVPRASRESSTPATTKRMQANWAGWISVIAALVAAIEVPQSVAVPATASPARTGSGRTARQSRAGRTVKLVVGIGHSPRQAPVRRANHHHRLRCRSRLPLPYKYVVPQNPRTTRRKSGDNGG